MQRRTQKVKSITIFIFNGQGNAVCKLKRLCVARVILKILRISDSFLRVPRYWDASQNITRFAVMQVEIFAYKVTMDVIAVDEPSLETKMFIYHFLGGNVKYFCKIFVKPKTGRVLIFSNFQGVSRGVC